MKVIQAYLPLILEISGLVLIYIEIKFPLITKNMTLKLQDFLKLFMYSDNEEWEKALKRYWSYYNFKNVESIYEKAIFVLAFIGTWVIPVLLITYYFVYLHNKLFSFESSQFIAVVVWIIMFFVVWFIYALFLVGPIRYFVIKIDQHFNGNVLGGVGFLVALLGFIIDFFI